MNIGVRVGVRCEDCLLDKLRDDMELLCVRFEEIGFDSLEVQVNVLRKLYDVVFGFILDLLVFGDEFIIVFDGLLWLVFIVVFMDFNLKFLGEFFRI